MAFSPEGLDFLTENMLNNSREWFRENKGRYEELVDKPMKELSAKLYEYIMQIDSRLEVVHISRIYRDARFAAHKGIFRENMWVSFSAVKDLYKSLPAFYFDISPAGVEYGCGFYVPPDGAMEKLRGMVKAGSPLYNAAQECIDTHPEIILYGDKYKRDRFPEASEKQKEWLGRKTCGVTVRVTDPAVMFSEELADIVGSGFIDMVPVYRLCLAAAEQA